MLRCVSYKHIMFIIKVLQKETERAEDTERDHDKIPIMGRV
jgi:hypothetical protein